MSLRANVSKEDGPNFLVTAAEKAGSILGGLAVRAGFALPERPPAAKKRASGVAKKKSGKRIRRRR